MRTKIIMVIDVMLLILLLILLAGTFASSRAAIIPIVQLSDDKDAICVFGFDTTSVQGRGH